MNWHAHPESWSFILRRYLPRLAICSLVWEVVQLPLYALWAEPRLERIAYAVAHCTAGDVLIGTAALLLALSFSGAGARASWPGTRIVMWMIVVAVAYTVLRERINLPGVIGHIPHGCRYCRESGSVWRRCCSGSWCRSRHGAGQTGNARHRYSPSLHAILEVGNGFLRLAMGCPFD